MKKQEKILLFQSWKQNRKIIQVYYNYKGNQQSMTDTLHTELEWFNISKAQFGFLSSHQIRKLSCCEIYNPQVYDSNKKPNMGGLYDAALGVSPNEREVICKTCGHYGIRCSGHPGHLELLVPTYNPMIIDVLMKMLKMSCFNCHHLRIKDKVKEDLQVKFILIKNGLISESKEFSEIDPEIERRKLKKLQKEKPKDKEDEGQRQIYKKKIQDCKASIQRVEKIKNKFRDLAEEKNKQNEANSASIEAFHQCLKYMTNLVQAKCPYCGTLAKNVKKQGANKIFLITTVKAEILERKKSRDLSAKGQSTYHMSADMTEQSHKEKKKRQRYVTPKEIHNELRKVWTNEQKLLDLLFGNYDNCNDYSMFFLKTVFVPPSRFRPESKLGDEKYLHDQTTILGRILQINFDLKMIMIQERLAEIIDKEGEKGKKGKLNDLKAMSTLAFRKSEWFNRIYKKVKTQPEFINKWLQLQDSINCYMDSTRSSKLADKDFKGVRQVLQKKEGLFRMKMMGKRVNYAARSVISPDPSLKTNEVGLPLFMAKKLTFPESVNEYNLEFLQNLVKNGKSYPGANFLEENGKMIKLDLLNDEKRLSLARNLLINSENKVVYRHMMNGDNVLFNRQPTLHKPGLMAHKIKVLPKQSTLRMNYANCKSYNADFDGDEMNLHAIQTYMGKAEAELCISDKMYNNPTNGKPLREIMQDAIIAAVFMTMKDTFFTKKQFSELLYQATFSLLEKKPANTRLFLIKPTIWKPTQLWTGKQLISNVIKVVVDFSNLRFKNQKGLCMKAKSKIGKEYMKGFEEEGEVLFIDNELLKGLIDKNQVGSGAQFGFIHSFNELYGEELTGSLITALTKLFLSYIQVHGFTCGIDDLVLKKKANKERRKMLNDAHEHVVAEICKDLSSPIPEDVYFMGRNSYGCDEEGEHIEEETQNHVRTDDQVLNHMENKYAHQEQAAQEFDAEYKHHLNPKSSEIIQKGLFGFKKMFPENNFSMMTLTGAKGSNVNHSMVSVMLGQQELEGRRVPIMISGKTLPSFQAYDPNPRASGYISDRFLSGLREQEFYFHCMSGREGLIDTAVKTSRSGYLQRCLMKHLETLKVQYDYTVRDCDGSIVQFLYGEDSLDPSKQKFFPKLDFIEDNFDLLKKKYKHKEFKPLLKTEEIFKTKEKIQSSMIDNKKKKTLMQLFPPGKNIGAISEKCFNMLKKQSYDMQFSEVYSLKYQHDMVQPGESVGCTAAQSIGQPSTQMTLNTFHLAGHGGVNLTLGIPRLRELLLTSSDKIKTPIMEMYFNKKVTKQEAKAYIKQLQKVKLCELINNIQVEEWKQLYEDGKLLPHTERKRYYKITIHYEKEEFIEKEFGLTYKHIHEKIEKTIVQQLLNHINRVKKRNQLKAEIKRVTNTQKDEDDEQKDEQDEGEQKKKIKKKEKQKNTEENKEDTLYQAKQFESLNFLEDGCMILIKVPLNLKKFLMTKVIEGLLKNCIMKEVPGIGSATILQKNDKPYIQTEGVNFSILNDLDFVEKETVSSNDIQAISKKFGIEAARNTLVKEIVTLFGAYGVTVDYRHLYLIGDYVTFGGNIKAMNRNWMAYSASPFLRMSYETSVKFITGAAIHCEMDNCRSPSSRIILGQNPELGTGMCDLLMNPNI